MMTAIRRSSNYAWYVVALLWPAALLNYLDRVMITTMRDPIRVELGMNDSQFGLLTSIFLWVYAAVSPLGGFLADRFGRRGMILGSVVFWSMATWLSAFSRNFGELAASRALMGLSEACYLPAALALIMDYHRERTRSLATGIHMTGLYLGTALGGAGGYLAMYHGWRFGFQLFGIIGVAYGVWLAFMLREASDATVRSPSAEPTAEDQSAKGSEFHVNWTTIAQGLLGQPTFWLLLVLNVLAGITGWVIVGWLPAFLKEHFDLNLGEAGLSATTYIQVAALVGVIVGGMASDAWSRDGRHNRSFFPAIGFLAAGPCLLLAVSTQHLAIAMSGLVVFGLARGCYDANLMPILRRTADERLSATGYGLFNFTSTAAGGIMVYVGGWLNDRGDGLQSLFQVCALGLVVVGLLLLAVRTRPATGSPIP